MRKTFKQNHKRSYLKKKRRTSRNGSSSRRHRKLVGGGDTCTSNLNYAPYNYDNYDRWRGNAGASVWTGATIPSNSIQDLKNWYEGKSTIFSPGKHDPTNQNQVQYLSQKPATPISIGSLQAPANSNLTPETTLGSILGNPISKSVFPEFIKTPSSNNGQIPIFRAGKRRRRLSRRRNRRSRRSMIKNK